MLGAMTDTSVRFWVRTADEAEVSVRVFNALTARRTPRRSKLLPPEQVEAMDYTGIVQVSGLEPATEYDYELSVDGKSALDWATSDDFARSPAWLTWKNFGSLSAAARPMCPRTSECGTRSPRFIRWPC